MGNMKSLQILRGSSSAISQSTDTLLAGQPLYDMTNNLLYVGDGSTTPIKSKTPIYAAGIKSSGLTLSETVTSGTMNINGDFNLNIVSGSITAGGQYGRVELKSGANSTYVNTVRVDQNYVTLQSQSTSNYAAGGVLELRGDSLHYSVTMGTSKNDYFWVSSAGVNVPRNMSCNGSVSVGSTQYLQLSSSGAKFIGNSGNSLTIDNSLGNIGINASSICLETSSRNLVLYEQGAWFGDSINMSTTFNSGAPNVTTVTSSGVRVVGNSTTDYTVVSGTSVSIGTGAILTNYGLTFTSTASTLFPHSYTEEGLTRGSYSFKLPSKGIPDSSSNQLGLVHRVYTGKTAAVVSTNTVYYYAILQTEASTGYIIAQDMNSTSNNLFANATSAVPMSGFYRGAVIGSTKGPICAKGKIFNQSTTTMTVSAYYTSTTSQVGTALVPDISIPVDCYAEFELFPVPNTLSRQMCIITVMG